MRARPNPRALAHALLAGDRAALSRAITLVESELPADQAIARELLAFVTSQVELSQNSVRIGITGSPGVGKSTFIEAYGVSLLDAGHRVAVLAVDPTSSRTNGSILGDKTRMPALAHDARAFVRPSPAGSTLGGLTASTRRAITLCSAAGYDRILVETVGVGQSEHAVHGLTDVMVLLVLPGGGDDLQGIKRGIVELAEIVLVTKADGDTAELARRTAEDYRRAVHLQPSRHDAWRTRVLTGSSVQPGGLAGFGESLAEYFAHLGPAGLIARRAEQRLTSFDEAWPRVLAEALRRNPLAQQLLQQFRGRIQAGGSDAEVAADAFAAALTHKLYPF